jgi:hypothetical protein
MADGSVVFVATLSVFCGTREKENETGTPVLELEETCSISWLQLLIIKITATKKNKFFIMSLVEAISN